MSGKPRVAAEKLRAVTDYLETGCDAEATAKRFDVCSTTLRKWLKEYRQTGALCEPRNTRWGMPEERKAENKPQKQTLFVILEDEYAMWVRQRAKRYGLKVSPYLNKVIRAMYKKAQQAGAKGSGER